MRKLITGNEAVALAALHAGVSVVTGYPGTPSTGALAALLEMSPLPGRHVEWSVNEKLALEVAAGAAWAGRRALCTMKMSGLNVAYDSLCSIAYSGTTGGLVIYVADDPGASAGMVEQDSRGFALMSDLPMLEPSGVAEAYTLAGAAFELSERSGAPVFLRLVAAVANSYAAVEVDAPLPPPDRPPVLARDIDRYTKAGAAICTAQHRAAIGRLEHAGQIISELGLNQLYLAPRPAIRRVDARVLYGGGLSGSPDRAGSSGQPPAPLPALEQPASEPESQALDLLRQAQDALRSIQSYLPGGVQDLMRGAQELLHGLHHTKQAQDVARQACDALREAQEDLAQLQPYLPHLRQPLSHAQNLLLLAQQRLAVLAAPSTEEAVKSDARPVVVTAGPLSHPLRRDGFGIIASGAAAAYVDEGLELFANAMRGTSVLESWPEFGPGAVSVLRIATPVPFPAVQVQALLRHCNTIVVLEELEPHVEREVWVHARALDWDGRILGKLGGPAVGGRTGEYGVAQVVRGAAYALDCAVPPDLLPAGQSAAGAEALAAARPITVCAGCPHRGTFMAINAALRKLRYKPGEVMVTGDIGCTILGMNPPFDTVWNEVAMGASIPLAQGFVHAGVQTPVIATIGDSTFFHAGIPGLINAVQHRVPLTLVILDNGWTAMTGMQTNPGTCPECQEAGGRSVDIAALVPALGVDHFRVIDPFDLPASTAAIQEALPLPGVKVLLARRECAIQAMRRGIRAGSVQVVAEKCNLCKLCIAQTGCPAISIDGAAVAIDAALCYGCGLCVETCHREAIVNA